MSKSPGFPSACSISIVMGASRLKIPVFNRRGASADRFEASGQ